MLRSFDRDGAWGLFWRVVGPTILITTLLTSAWSVMKSERLADCERRRIQVQHARSQFTETFDALDARERDNISHLIEVGISRPSLEQWEEATRKYSQEKADIQADTLAAQRARDRYVYPSLDDCD